MKAIKLNENYRIEKDTYSWTLIFNEEREKEKLDDKKKKTGVFEPFVYEEKWYYPDIKQVLNKFIDLELKDCETIAELSAKMNLISEKIDSLKNTIFRK